MARRLSRFRMATVGRRPESLRFVRGACQACPSCRVRLDMLAVYRHAARRHL